MGGAARRMDHVYNSLSEREMNTRKFLEMIGFGLAIAAIDTMIGAMFIKNGWALAVTFVAVFFLAIFFYSLCRVAGDDDKRAGRDG